MQNKFALWAQVVGNFGIVLSLLFVGLQMQQERELKALELAWESLDSAREQHKLLLVENPQTSMIKAAFAPEAMTEEDVLILHNYFRSDLFQTTQLALMVEHELFSPDVLAAATETSMLNTPFGQLWLNSGALATHHFSAEKEQEIQNRRNDPDGTKKWIQQSLEHLRGTRAGAEL